MKMIRTRKTTVMIRKMNKNNKNKTKYFFFSAVFIFLFLFLIQGDFLPKRVIKIDNSSELSSLSVEFDAEGNSLGNKKTLQFEVSKKEEIVKHVKTPESVKAIYMTACVASTKNFRDDLVKLIEETEINSIIIDIKDYTGTISFDSGLAGDGGTGCRTNDLKEFIKELHDKNIYVMGRISVFQDKHYGTLHPELMVKRKSDKLVWNDNKGIGFVDVGAQDFWDYIIDLSIISHEIGFDEVNYDYVRFPSDGNMNDIYFPFSQKYIDEDEVEGRSVALEKFFMHLDEKIHEYNNGQEFPLITSADLFGMVTTANNDLKIGQILEKALPYFDYIAPMVYPSHYPPGFNGWDDPNKFPYELIHYVMSSAVEKINNFDLTNLTDERLQKRISINQLRPWLQDFNYGGTYGPEEVRAQIDATYDAGLSSWMLWAPSNRYTKNALESN